jgi:hypothetical protein
LLWTHLSKILFAVDDDEMLEGQEHVGETVDENLPEINQISFILHNYKEKEIKLLNSDKVILKQNIFQLKP